MNEKVIQVETITAENLISRVKLFFPILFELLGNNKIDWHTIAQNFDEKVKEYKAKHEMVQMPFQIPASFYFMISSALTNKDMQWVMLRDFIEKLFEELSDSMDKTEKGLIVNNIYGVIVHQNEEYLNYVGELLALH